MNKNILALAVLTAFAGVAQAQSSVNVYGSIDGGLRNQTNTDAAGKSKLTMSSIGQYYANRLGFSGSEDLGGGLKANFVLEAGFNTGTGAMDNANNVLFNRSSWVGISGSWGQLSLGRQYTTGFWVVKEYDPFGIKYVAIVPVSGGGGTTLPTAATTAGLGASATSGIRFNNDVQYTRSLGPLTLRAEYAAGEQAGSASKGATQAVGFKYAEGPLSLGGAYTQKKTITGFDNKSVTVGGAYKLGAARATLGYGKETQSTAAAGDFTNKTAWGGLNYVVTPEIELTGAWYRTKFTDTKEGKRDLFIVGATVAFSKRTKLYADIDSNRYSGALIPKTNQTSQLGISAGISHMF